MQKPENNVLIIFGASGDLTARKLMPALFNLYCKDSLPERFAALGVSRTSYSDEEYRRQIFTALELYSEKHCELSRRDDFLKRVFYFPLSSYENGDFTELKKRLNGMEVDSNYIFYLSTPPKLYGLIPEQLGKAGLNGNSKAKGWRRLIVEKPFGFDLSSAIHLNKKIQRHFKEDQVYRIDHYLGKETVQNIIAFRFSNGIFEPLWNRNYIHHVEITAAETLGVETRGSYYDESGALRDMLQNHLLQLLATVAMEPPARFNARAVRDETVKVFYSLRPLQGMDINRHVVRGQYTASTFSGQKVPGYTEEKNIPADSSTETFVAAKVYIDNWRWGGVPFYLRSGKRLPARVTEIVIHFKKTPHSLFTTDRECHVRSNRLIIRIQPDEGILLNFGMKKPGAGFRIGNVDMDFRYTDLGDKVIASAYERLLLDCMLGDATLYTRSDAVEACWAFVDPVLNAWKNDSGVKLYPYPAGSWGPSESQKLFEDQNEGWHNST